MPVEQIPAGTIVVGVDGSASSDRALAWAITQARLEKRPLTLVHSSNITGNLWMAPTGLSPDAVVALQAAARADASSLLSSAREHVQDSAPDLEVHEVLEVADPRDVLLELSHRAHLMVLGSRGRGQLRSLLLGSVGLAVTRHATCPVVIVRPGKATAKRYGIVVGVDGTESSLPALEFAFRQASLHGLPLTVLHAFRDVQAYVAGPHLVTGESAAPVAERLLLAESVSGMGEKYPDVRSRTDLAMGLADDCLVVMSRTADLVVVGSHHGGAASEILFGSVAASVVEHAACPVSVIPSTDRR